MSGASSSNSSIPAPSNFRLPQLSISTILVIGISIGTLFLWVPLVAVLLPFIAILVPICLTKEVINFARSESPTHSENMEFDSESENGSGSGSGSDPQQEKFGLRSRNSSSSESSTLLE